jgi:hypothetical protein
MRRCVAAISVVAVLLWASGSLLAQGQGKGGEKKERIKAQDSQGAAQQNPQAAQAGEEKGSGKDKGTDKSGKGKGKGQEQQEKAFQKQLQRTQAKHLERQARLNRIRELALKKGDQETVARVDKLLAKEAEVHGRKQARLQGQPRAVEAPAGTEKIDMPATAPDLKGKAKGMGAAVEEKAGKAIGEATKDLKKTEAAPDATKKQ